MRSEHIQCSYTHGATYATTKSQCLFEYMYIQLFVHLYICTHSYKTLAVSPWPLCATPATLRRNRFCQ